MTVSERASVNDLTCTTVYESDISELKCKILDCETEFVSVLFPLVTLNMQCYYQYVCFSLFHTLNLR